jgi:hypothetical protein
MTTFRTVVSSVAKVCSLQNITGIHQCRFPTLVYPTRATRATIAAAFPFVCRLLWFYLSIIRSRTIRRSVSISVSWSTHPDSSFWRSKCVHNPDNRGSINTLRQFDLCSRIGSFGTLRKNRDQVRPVQNFTFGYDFRYILLGWRQFIIKYQGWYFVFFDKRWISSIFQFLQKF